MTRGGTPRWTPYLKRKISDASSSCQRTGENLSDIPKQARERFLGFCQEIIVSQ